MRSVSLLLALVGFLLVRAAEVEVEENVLVVTQDNFQQIVNENEFVLMEFYAPWCGHCKALAPEYAKAATQMADDGSDIKLAKVDATEQTELADEYGVQRYPTIKFFKGGNASEYAGGRTAREIVTWLNKRTGPPAEALDTAEAAKAFTTKDEFVVVGFFENTESDNAQVYINAADTQDSIYFGIVTSKDVAEYLEASMESVVVFKKFDEGRATFNKEFTAENIVTFVLGEQLPLVAKFSDESAPKIFGGEIKTQMLAFFEGDNEEYLNGLREAAKEYRGQVLFVQVDTSEDSPDRLRITEFFGIKDDDIPTCRLVNLAEDVKKFVPEFSGVGGEDVKEFVGNYLEGKLKVHLNTEEVPEDWNSNPVKVLVGKNFEEVAMDPTKHVFVEFYAPWCGQCKQLAPIWDDLGEHFANDEDVIIAKMDATKNEVESVQVQAFPTLKFITKDTNEVIDYSGERTLDALIEYVEGQVSGETGDDTDTDTDSDDEGKEAEPEEVPLDKDEL